jgi:hypothetical protein
MCRMQINPIVPPNAAAPAVKVEPKAKAAPVQAPVAPKQDTLFLSQKAKDMAAQLSGKTMQEENKESPVVETTEGEAKK